MTLRLIYWILMLLWLVGGIVGPTRLGPWQPMGSTILLFILLLILGWAAFGQPIQG